MSVDQWVLSPNGEEFVGDFYRSRNEAISAGMRMAEEVVGPDVDAIEDTIDDTNIFYQELSDGDGPFSMPPDFFVGISDRFEPDVNEDKVIECLHDDAESFAGEVAEDWLEWLRDTDRHKLHDMLQAAFDRWAKETRNEPDFYNVWHIEHIDGGSGRVIE